VDLKVGVGHDEGQMETFGGEAVAHKANFDGRHVDVGSEARRCLVCLYVEGQQ
jgi:hypothetical protein